MYVSPNLQNFYRTKQASLMDYLKSMGIGAGIGGGAGAGLGAWGGSKWDDSWEELGGNPITPEDIGKILAFVDRRVPGMEDGTPLHEATEEGLYSLDPGGPQAATYALLHELVRRGGLDGEMALKIQAGNKNPKTTGAVLGGLGGAALGAGGGLGYQALKDLLFSGGK